MNHISAATGGQTKLWFATHEARLMWRDFSSLMTGGKPHRTVTVGVIVLLFVAGMHWLATVLLAPLVTGGLVADKAILLYVSGALVMMFSLMFSQAIESVTRAYYARSDLDLILSSPAPSHRLFEVRTLVLALQTVSLSVLIASPVINVLAVLDGAHWLAAYGVLVALGCCATSLATGVTLFLFKAVGPARTRLIAQIIAAVVGAGFVIALQVIGIMFGQGISRFSLFTSAETLAFAPGPDNLLWWPAKAAMGDFWSTVTVVSAGGLIMILTTRFSARRFATDALATAGLVERRETNRVFTGFRANSSVRGVLRHKEWALLKRDPWLISQSLQQILYLVPPAVLLWFNYGAGGIFYVVVPVTIMATGQLAGGLAWITISGEDAHELIDTAPVPERTILRAKVEAVLGVVTIVLLPFAIMTSLFSLPATVAMILGVAAASGSAVLIQLMFRSQANRSLFRRRQVSSKAATLCEALVSILWAAGAGLALVNPLLALPSVVLVAIVLGVAWLIKPDRA